MGVGVVEYDTTAKNVPQPRKMGTKKGGGGCLVALTLPAFENTQSGRGGFHSF